MRFGNLRGVTFAIALTALVITGTARADWFHHAIPKVTAAMDYRTGGQYYAPPIPYGHYAKDGTFGLGKHFDMLKGSVHGLASKLHGAGSGLGNGGCADCNGGGHGNGLGGHGLGGHGLGLGHGGSGDCATGDCGGSGHGLGLGLGHGGTSHMFGKKHFGKLHGAGSDCVDCGTPIASAQAPAPVVKAAPQTAAVASSQASPCGMRGCGIGGKHGHGGSIGGHGLGLGGNGLGLGGHGLGKGLSACGSCGGRGQGCGACGGRGFFGNTGHGACGGAGCNSCLGNLIGAGHGLASKAHGMLYGLLHPHAGKVQYFVGAGGPVPITPGYVNYVNPVRSPRDFFAFPPMSPVE